MDFDNYDPRRLIDELEAKVEQAKQNAAAVAETVGHGEAADGLVKVTVGPSGALKSLEFDPRAMRLPSVDLAAAVLEAARAGQADVLVQVREIYSAEQTGGLDIAAMAQGEVDVSALIDERMQKARDALQRSR